MTQAIKIFQIYYRPEQVSSLDPAFEALDNAGVNDPFLEFGVIKRLHDQPANAALDYWGAVSWKFQQKTGLSGGQLYKFIRDRPGYDVYYCNPHPHVEGLHYNLFLQGHARHADFLSLTQQVLPLAGLDMALTTMFMPPAAFAAANYIVATPAFWSRYIAFVDRIMQPALSDQYVPLRTRLLSQEADPKNLHAGASYVPFIVERLFGLFLASEDCGDFRAKKYPLPARESNLDMHQRSLRDMKEVAWSTRSLWLAKCWLNYRNLYLTRNLGEEWAQNYLPALSPDPITFGTWPHT